MNSKLNLVILVTLFCCVIYVTSQHVGGLSAEKEPGDEVREILNQVQKEFEKSAEQEFESIRPITYRTQMVAGQNYFIKVLTTTRDGKQSHHHLRVWKPFRGPLVLSAIRKDIHEREPLEYFQ